MGNLKLHKITVDDEIRLLTADEIIATMSKFGHNYVEFARQVAATLDNRPEIRVELIERGLFPQTVDRLEMVGRGQLHHRLLLCSAPYAEKLALLPMSQQHLALENGVEVLEPDEITTSTVRVEKLSGRQVSQVFGDKSVRTIQEQRTWVNEQKRKNKPAGSTTENRALHTRVTDLERQIVESNAQRDAANSQRDAANAQRTELEEQLAKRLEAEAEAEVQLIKAQRRIDELQRENANLRDKQVKAEQKAEQARTLLVW